MTDKQNHFTHTDNTSDNNDKTMENLHKQIIDTTKCAWKSFEGTYCPEVEQLLKRKEKELMQVSKAYERCKERKLKAYNKFQEKAQECEKLKHDNEYEVGTLEITIDHLKAELEQEQALKETYLACYRTKHEELADKYEALKVENNELKNRVAELSLFQLYKIQRDEAEQTLLEIKEIAKYELNNLTESAINGGRYVEILQKISEVIDENI